MVVSRKRRRRSWRTIHEDAESQISNRRIYIYRIGLRGLIFSTVLLI
jgi:hypothetical protein